MSKSIIRRSAQEIIAAYPSHVGLDAAYLHIQAPNGLIIVQPGETGYWPAPAAIKTLDELDAMLERVFNARRPTAAERLGAQIGSLIGWEVPGADPLNHADLAA